MSLYPHKGTSSIIQIFFLAFFVVHAFVKDDGKITNLPGLPSQPKFSQYASYMSVDDKNERYLFYWFMESQSDPANDPVVLWLTGGPGCSSLLALFTENGAFVPNADGTLSYNSFSWNNHANMLWLESPAGVGFSYSNNQTDYTVGDVRTANDTYNFLVNFFQTYPQFRSNDFWVTGESYGGHYVPEAVQRILKGNEAGNPVINLKGFMVGNPWTYMPLENYGAVNTWWTRGLVPKSAADSILNSCNLSDVGPLLLEENLYQQEPWTMPDQCPDAISNTTQLFSSVDIYDIYTDICLAQQTESIYHRLYPFLSKDNDQRRDISDPCIENYLDTYLNLPTVQDAIHAKKTEWSSCSPVVMYNYEDIKASVLPVYNDFFQNYPSLKILVYSGDVDAIVPYWGTSLWVEALKRPIKEPWRQWFDSRQQVGGFVVVYDRFTFATVRNAGHMVPGTQPLRGSLLFNTFLQTGRLP